MKLLRATTEVIILIIEVSYLTLGSIIIIPIAVTIVVTAILYDRVKTNVSNWTINKKSNNEDSES